MAKPRTMRRPLTPASEKLLLTLFDGGKLNDMEALRLLQRKNMLNIRDDGSIALTDLGKCSARTLLHERGYPQKRDVAAKLIAFALVLGMLFSPTAAKAACAPSDLIGTWDFYVEASSNIKGYWYGVRILANGTILGSVRWLDGASTPYPFTITAETPMTSLAASKPRPLGRGRIDASEGKA